MRRCFIRVLVCFVILSAANCFNSSAQTIADSTNYLYQPATQTRLTIQLLNDNIITGKVFRIWDSCLAILLQNGMQDPGCRLISVSEMRTVKVKRDAFLEAMPFGIFIGGTLGYGAGSVAYDHDHSVSDQENDDSQQSSAWTGAVIGAIPYGVLGGIVGGVALRKKFEINGSQENFRKLVNLISY